MIKVFKKSEDVAGKPITSFAISNGTHTAILRLMESQPDSFDIHVQPGPIVAQNYELCDEEEVEKTVKPAYSAAICIIGDSFNQQFKFPQL